ncbi:hypothetical protein [Pseudonocardia phyllosphaerae]|uniref:hypothetical protein n=1 Tax=Pseudonocardia phyllosphaerae TaxID=3390502 RepID=UPI00397E6727
MRLYLPARTPARGRTLVRAGRPAKSMPAFGGIAPVCRCGAARPADATPWRDCPECASPRRVAGTAAVGATAVAPAGTAG